MFSIENPLLRRSLMLEISVVSDGAQKGAFERVSATVGLRFRETGFCGAETTALKGPVTFSRSSAETRCP